MDGREVMDRLHEASPSADRDDRRLAGVPEPRQAAAAGGLEGDQMKTLVICNDPPYATERSWNGCAWPARGPA